MSKEAYRHLDPRIVRNIEEQNRLGGIDARKLEPGTLLEVRTRNTLYRIEVAGRDGDVLVEGGEYFPERRPAVLTGSTWGGSMLKIGWVGHSMHMEFVREDGKVITTSAVREARIIGPGWEYAMDWQRETPAAGGRPV